jgi:hypothetical protein
MGMVDRRRLGVTFISVLKAAKKVTANPDFLPTSRRDIAESILEEIIGKNLPQAREAEPGIDWDGLLAFIEKLLPIILQLLAIFGV